jgi:hypothetical protein
MKQMLSAAVVRQDRKIGFGKGVELFMGEISGSIVYGSI